MRRALALVAMLTCVAGCAASRPAPPAHLGRTIAVLPPNNLTGDRLPIAGEGLIDRYLRDAAIVTVPDVLQSEARRQLEENGFEVPTRQTVEAVLKGRTPTSAASAAQLAAPAGAGLALYIEIRRWEADAPTHAGFVIAGLGVSLVDPATGAILWTVDRRSAPVPTPGEVNVQAAYVTAARRVVKDLPGPLRPDPAAGATPSRP